MTFKDTETDYAFWSSPDQSFTVIYSLEQFHEIDFQVSEAYRRIPHGGIEMGGLLFGRNEPGGIRVEAFRPIACEHATGPSFNLSERDLQDLQKQIEAFRSDTDLARMELLGWFIAHTRTPFQLTDREAALFDRFFPRRDQITVLVKPERFQPTRFAFLVRNPEGRMERDGALNAIILPLPGRSSRAANGPLPSIPAPAEPVGSAPPVEPTSDLRTAGVPPAAKSPQPSKEPEATRPTQQLEPGNVPKVPPDIRERHGVTRPRTAPLSQEKLSPEEKNVPVTEPPRPANAPPASTVLTTIEQEIESEKKLPSIDEIKARRTGRGTTPAQQYANIAYGFQLALILLLAAVLGCAAGYWAYRQLPPPVVPLAVHPVGSDVVITWPTEQTRNAAYAGVRVNDGAQQQLSADEKRGGAVRVPISPGSSLKVELIVQHWLRDSRGIVRYVSAVPSPPAASPPTDQHSTR